MFDKNDETIYCAGEVVLVEEPDWEDFIKGIRVYNRMHPHKRLSFSRSSLDDDGACRVPFTSEAGAQTKRRGVGGVQTLTHDEAVEDLFVEMGDDIREFFGGDVELRELVPSFGNSEDLDILDEHFSKITRSPLAPPRQLSADDLKPETSAGGNAGDAYAELDSLIGLTEVKRQVHNIVTAVRNHGREQLPCLHMSFTGNPGTGKTTVARIIGKIFDQEGITSGKGVFVEADRSKLCAAYVGQTALQTAKILKQAEGGVLFIDEAYALGMHDSGRDYGPEAIATIVKAMEDKRDKFVCILAGYPQPMEQMIAKNPGMRDRIAFHIEFPDYSAAELVEVFKLFAATDGFRLSSAALRSLERAIEDLVANKGEDFSNGRIVRNMYERIRMNHMISSTSRVFSVSCVETALADADLSKLLTGKATGEMGFC